MNVGVGDTVLVNAAAFIASRFRNREAIPCEVLEVEVARVFVRTNHPYRVFTMWITKEWIAETDCVARLVSR